MPAPFRSNRNLWLLWTGRVNSHSADAIYQMALPWLVLELAGSKTTTSPAASSTYLAAAACGLAGLSGRGMKHLVPGPGQP